MPKASKASKLRREARRVAATTASLDVPMIEAAVVSSQSSKNTTASSTSVAHAEPSSAIAAIASVTATKSSSGLSRGQRKRQAKREQYLKREQMILSTLKLKQEEEQKTRIDGLDAIRAALLNTKKEGSQSAKQRQQQHGILQGKTSKSKQKLLNNELNHYSLVLQHPSYQSNPFETMQEHLRNTLAKQKEQQQIKSSKRTQDETTQREKEKQLKKEQRDGLKKKKSRKKFKATRSR